nr:tetratricopeptide repeat protein [Deltaproteobacteria bacterium]
MAGGRGRLQAWWLRPQSAEAHQKLGVLCMYTERPDEAIEALREAVRLKPDMAHAHYSLGLAMRQKGLSEDGLLHVENAARLDPRDPTLQAGLGYMLAEGGRLQEAEAYQERHQAAPRRRRLAPRGPAMLMGQLGRDEEAIRPSAGCSSRRQTRLGAPRTRHGLQEDRALQDAVDPLRRASRQNRSDAAAVRPGRVPLPRRRLEQRAGRVRSRSAAEPPAGRQALRPHQRVGAAEPSAGRHRGV